MAEPKIISREHPEWGFYVEQHSGGWVSAGATAKTARQYYSAQEAYDYYRPYATTDHRAWNICYALEDLIGDEG
jgi:hypothetical protein